MGRPIKIAKGAGIDSGLSNNLGLGVIGGDSTIAGNQLKCKFNLDGTVMDGYIVRQKGTRKFLVSSLDNMTTGVCFLQDTDTPSNGGMSISITTATAGVKYLTKFNDVIGETFDGSFYYLTMKSGGESSIPPVGMAFEIAAVQVL